MSALTYEQLRALELATSGYLSLERLERFALWSETAAWQLSQLERLEGHVGVADVALLADVAVAWAAEGQHMSARRTRLLVETFAAALRSVTPLRYTLLEVHLITAAVYGLRCLDVEQRAGLWNLAQRMQLALGAVTVAPRYSVTAAGAAALASLEQLELLERES